VSLKIKKKSFFAVNPKTGILINFLIRDGHVMEPKERRVSCISIELTDFRPPFYTLYVRCGGGFYVRSLIHDIGKGESKKNVVRRPNLIQSLYFSLN